MHIDIQKDRRTDRKTIRYKIEGQINRQTTYWNVINKCYLRSSIAHINIQTKNSDWKEEKLMYKQAGNINRDERREKRSKKRREKIRDKRVIERKRKQKYKQTGDRDKGRIT